MAEFKYQSQIDALVALGAPIPPLREPSNLRAYRYIFANDERCLNHIPPFVVSPTRAIVKDIRKVPPVEGFALSCYLDGNKAIDIYFGFINERPMLHKSLGDTLCSGNIANDDGKVTNPNADTHFELFEFVGCNLNNTFTKIERVLV